MDIISLDFVEKAYEISSELPVPKEKKRGPGDAVTIQNSKTVI